MGQGIGGNPEAPAVGGDAKGREPIGRYIAQQRRLRGVDLDDLAARTRIPRRSLERLEAGAFDHSPDGFSRGFVRTVAEAIGLDPDDAVARMLPEPDAARHEAPRPRPLLGAVAAAIALAAIGLAVREWRSAPSAPVAVRPQGDLPVRRDYVRALAEREGVAVATLGERAALLPPLPPESPADPAPAGAEPTASALAAAPQSASPAASTLPAPAHSGSPAAEGAPARTAAPVAAPAPAPSAAPEREPAVAPAEALASEAPPQSAPTPPANAANDADAAPSPRSDAEDHD